MIVRTIAACALIALAACQPAEPAADKEGDAADHAALAAVDPLISAEQVCAMFGPGASASERIKDMGTDELGAFTRMMDDRAALMRTALEAQGREIEKIAEGR